MMSPGTDHSPDNPHDKEVPLLVSRSLKNEPSTIQELTLKNVG